MENESFLEGNGIIILILFFLMLGGGFGGFSTNANRGAYATQEDLYATANQQTINGKLDGLAQTVNNSQFATQQGFANVAQTLNSGFDSVNANITNLGYQMSQCCCDLKSQMLQDKYESVSRELNVAVNAAANATQSQYLLGQLGRYVPYGTIGTTIA